MKSPTLFGYTSKEKKKDGFCALLFVCLSLSKPVACFFLYALFPGKCTHFSCLLFPGKCQVFTVLIRTVKNVSDWLLLFKDLPKLLRALTRRDLPTIMQAVQTSPRFYAICENCGLFTVEPPLWNMVCDEIQAGRL